MRTLWAEDIVNLQQPDGSWGFFHSLSSSSGKSITTEQALRRLNLLGLSARDQSITKAICYLERCLSGEVTIPDRREKVQDWDVFSSLMLATWLKVFCPEHQAAQAVARKWGAVVEAAFASGEYSEDGYKQAYNQVFGALPPGARLINLFSFYLVSLLQGTLSVGAEVSFVYHILSSKKGIYYIYDKELATPPSVFASRESNRYLAALELLAGYEHAAKGMGFAVDWLLANRDEIGRASCRERV